MMVGYCPVEVQQVIVMVSVSLIVGLGYVVYALSREEKPRYRKNEKTKVFGMLILFMTLNRC